MRLSFLTKKKFREWLSGFSSYKVVGRSDTTQFCPIAIYVKESKKIGDVIVDNSTISFKGKIYTMPLWARKFIIEIDSIGNSRKVDSRKVTAFDALNILESIK